MVNDHLMGRLEELADSGKTGTVMFLMGPPCRTVSAARHADDGGPRPLRSRVGEGRFGLQGINSFEEKLVQDDAVLMLRGQWLARKAKRANNLMESMMEQPRDPADPQRCQGQGLRVFFGLARHQGNHEDSWLGKGRSGSSCSGSSSQEANNVADRHR